MFPPSTVDVAWSNEGDTIVVKCAGKTFIHLILGDSNDDAPQFLSINEDPVVVTLTDEDVSSLTARSNECGRTLQTSD